MTNYEQQLCAQVLRLAADTFIIYRCNDYSVGDCLEARTLYEDIAEWSGDKQEQGEDFQIHLCDGKVWFLDYQLMNYLAHLLEKEKTT